ncbi:MAG: glycosyltransferase family 4 protein [Armatimonadota bacterium]
MSEQPAKRHGKSVLILVENLPVPHDRRVWLEATSLQEAGFHVSVISPCPPKSKKWDVIDDVHVYRYNPPPTTRRRISFVWEFFYCWMVTFGLSLVVWAREGIDAVHACNPPDTFWLIGRFYQLFGKKYVFDHHDLCPELYAVKFPKKRGRAYKGIVWLEKMQFKSADWVISTNESYRQVAIERGGLPPERVTVVRSGPDLSSFKRLPTSGAYKGQFKYLAVFLGVMDPQDNLDSLLRSFHHIVYSLQRTDIGYLMIGGGDAEKDAHALVKKLGLGEYVQFTGFLRGETLLLALSEADIAVVPDPMTPLDDKSTKNKVIEYMALGIPQVCYDMKETRFSAQQAAAYVTPGNEQEFARTVVELLDDPERRQKMAQFGIDRVINNLAWNYSRDVLINIYENLLDVPQTDRVTQTEGNC